MKFFGSEKAHFSEKTFSNIKKCPQSSNILIFSSIEILIKINLETFLEISDLKNFMGFMTI